MSTVYKHRAVIIVAESHRDEANALAADIDPDTGGAATFGVPLSANGRAPATHYGRNLLLTDAGRDRVAQLAAARSWAYVLVEPAGLRPSVELWDEAVNDLGLEPVTGEEET